MSQRRRLSDILGLSQQDALARAWQTAKPAQDRGPIPSGVYEAYIVDGQLFISSRGTAGYKVTFEVCHGEYAGRRIWHDLWLTPAAIAMTKRDLEKLGVTTLEQLEGPLPQGIKCRIKVALRQNDAGESYNVVRDFNVIAIERPTADPFAPQLVDKADASGDSDNQQWEVRF
jgi:hypothetical protein